MKDRELAEELRKLIEISEKTEYKDYLECVAAFKRIETLLQENLTTIIEALEK